MSYLTSNVKRLILLGLSATKSSEQLRHGSWAIRWVSRTIKIGVSSAAIYFIYNHVDWILWNEVAYSLYQNSRSSIQLSLYLFFALLLMAANWGIEAFKWHMLIHPVFGTPWLTSVKGVLSGATFGVFSGNRFGEFVGRVLSMQPQHRISASFLSGLNGLAQSMATLTFGLLGFCILVEIAAPTWLGIFPARVLQMTLILSWLVSLTLYSNLDLLFDWLRPKRWFANYQKHLEATTAVSPTTIHILYILSLLRFMTFIAQYYLVYEVLSDDLQWLEIAGAAMLTMFSSTLLSVIPVPDFLLKQSLAIAFFGLFNAAVAPVSVAVLLVWTINVAMPALMGAAALFTYKLFR